MHVNTYSRPENGRLSRSELGLLPDANSADGSTTYWGVSNVQSAMDEAIALGAVEHTPATDVGEGITTGTVRLPDGLLVGFIDNPNFKLQ